MFVCSSSPVHRSKGNATETQVVTNNRKQITLHSRAAARSSMRRSPERITQVHHPSLLSLSFSPILPSGAARVRDIVRLTILQYRNKFDIPRRDVLLGFTCRCLCAHCVTTAGTTEAYDATQYRNLLSYAAGPPSNRDTRFQLGVIETRGCDPRRPGQM